MSRKHDDIYYRRSDRKAILMLLAVVAVCSVALYFLASVDGTDAGPATDIIAAERADTFKNRRFHRQDTRYYAVGGRQTELFPFDPNTADSTALLRLGLQPWQVRNIYKYRARGGVYRRPEDFARLYGLTVGQYRRMKPYIRISGDFLPAASLPEAVPAERDTLRYPVKISDGEHVVLNTADTAQLRRVPGIGSGFARAIVDYGARLGGYVSVDQLDEIDDFPEESKKYFVVSHPETVRLNVNKLSVIQLRRHPYITFHQAKAIADYRRLHGPLRSLQDLRLHRDFTPEAISRLEPYVEF